MLPKLQIVLVVLLILAFSATNVGAAPLEKLNCDPAFVSQQKNILKVKPTGADDTANLQCAFDVALEGKAKTVQLTAGTFYTRQIAVQNFRGRFTGAGAKKTVIMNIPNLEITPNFWFSAPSAENLWPTLFSFVDGDVLISDLAIHIAGSEPTTGWEYAGMPVLELYGAIFINGTNANAAISNVLIEGEPMPEAIFGYNLLNGIYYTGFIGETEPYPPMIGTFAVYNSTFRTLDIGTPVTNLSNANVLISKNTYEDVWAALEAVDTQGSNIVFTNNQANAIVGIYLHEQFNTETSHANFLIKNNTLSGGTGIVVDTIFGEDVECLLLRNDTEFAVELGVYLGFGTTGCLVTGKPSTTVLDLGTDNTLVGVTRLEGMSPAAPEKHQLTP